jgi:hypothetical protein
LTRIRSRRDPLQLEVHRSRASADVREAQEGERRRFTQAALLSIVRRIAAKLDEARLVRLQRQGEPLQALPQFCLKALGVALVLKTGDYVAWSPVR